MAAKKTSSSGRSSSGRKSTSGKSKSSSSRFSWESEVLLFVVLAFCVLLFIANVTNAGTVGNALSNFFFGLFGVMSYIFPVALFLLAVYVIYNRFSEHKSKYHYRGRAVVKSVAGVFCFLFFCVIFHRIYFGSSLPVPADVYRICSAEKRGGGIFGGIVGNGFARAFGIPGTYVISIIILILCVLLITEHSLVRPVSEKVADSQDRARDRAQAEKKERKESAPERTTRRSERIFSGVTTDVDLKPISEKADDTDEEPEIVMPQKESSRMSEVDMSAVGYSEEIFPEEEEFMEDGPNIYVSGQETTVRPSETSEIIEEEEKPAPKPKKTTTKKEKQSMEEMTEEISGISATVAEKSAASHGNYVFPSIRLLHKGDPRKAGDSKQHLQQMSARLQETLETFGVNARVTNVVCGPAVTQYEVQPEMGVKVSKILSLADDIKLNLMVSDIRIEAPIPGKAAVGIEVPNTENVTVALRDLLESPEFKRENSGIWFCVGKDIAGNVIVADIDKMPHLLIAGATGSGKSVCINTIIMSLLYKYSPDEVKLIMIDPKVVELNIYNNIPHLLIPVVTDPKKAAGALHWAVAEMTERYNKFAELGVRDIEGYNKKIETMEEVEGEEKPQRMPSIVIIVDELADLMMVAASDVEDAICRLAQLARAAGLHLIIATQRPSVNVITGLIKANMPSRIAFAVTSGVDSRTILDMNGAEKLLGKGDMLFYPQGYPKPLRVQGAFVNDSEVAKVVNDVITKNGQYTYNADVEDKVTNSESMLGTSAGFPSTDGDRDVYFDDAARFLIEKEKGSIGMLQRNFKIGFNRAARIMDQLEEAGIVGPEEGTKPRRVLVTMEEYEEKQYEN